MACLRKRLLAAAGRCDHYWDLSGDLRWHWMFERAYRMGRADLRRELARRAVDRPLTAVPQHSKDKERPS